MYAQWIVDLQNAEYECALSKSNISNMELIGKEKYSFVAFAETRCHNNPSHVLKIVYPMLGKRNQTKVEAGTKAMVEGRISVGVCPKLLYGDLDPQQLIEWFEYHRLMGVSRIFTYNAELFEAAQKIFDYYNNNGFLETYKLHPPARDGGKPAHYRQPRYSEQVWVDEVVATTSADNANVMSGQPS